MTTSVPRLQSPTERRLTAGTVFLADCPARLAIEIIANKWAVVTLFALTEGPKRHGELVALAGGSPGRC